MTTKAIEAGARAISARAETYPTYALRQMNDLLASELAAACIEAAIASGELVPASAVAAERERCVRAVRDERLEYMVTPDDHSYNNALDHAEQAICNRKEWRHVA